MGTNGIYIFYRIFQENERGFAHICRFYNEIVKKCTIEAGAGAVTVFFHSSYRVSACETGRE